MALGWLVDWLEKDGGLVGWWVGGLVGWWVGGLVGWWVAGLLGCWVGGLTDWWVDSLVKEGGSVGWWVVLCVHSIDESALFGGKSASHPVQLIS